MPALHRTEDTKLAQRRRDTEKKTSPGSTTCATKRTVRLSILRLGSTCADPLWASTRCSFFSNQGAVNVPDRHGAGVKAPFQIHPGHLQCANSAAHNSAASSDTVFVTQQQNTKPNSARVLRLLLCMRGKRLSALRGARTPCRSPGRCRERRVAPGRRGRLKHLSFTMLTMHLSWCSLCVLLVCPVRVCFIWCSTGLPSSSRFASRSSGFSWASLNVAVPLVANMQLQISQVSFVLQGVYESLGTSRPSCHSRLLF